MSFTRMMEGNEAAAWGAKLSRVEVIPAYPITPQTELISNIASMIAEGKMKAEYIKVEGEHTAMAARLVPASLVPGSSQAEQPGYTLHGGAILDASRYASPHRNVHSKPQHSPTRHAPS